MGCEKEASDECKQNGFLFHGKRVSSFFKVMIDKSFLKILYFPPTFARSVSHLTDQETYLEDSSGQRWRVKVCNHKGSLAIRQGWPEFSSEHGLNLGDFLVFYYVEGQYFLVQIYDKSGCQKIKFYSDFGKGKRKIRTYPEATSQVKLLQTTDINPANKRSKISAVSESEKVPCKTHITKFATNIDADTGKGQLVYPAVYVDESFCMIDRDAQYHQGDDRLCLHLSSFEMPASKPLAEGTSSLLKADGGNSNHVETNLRSQTEPNLVVVADYLNSEELLPKFEAEITGTDMVPAEDIPLLSQKDQNDCPSGIISSSFLKRAANVNKNDDVSNVTKYQNHWMSTDTKSMMLQSDNKDGRCTGSNQITREKSNEASQFARETRLVKKEFKDTAATAYYPARAISASETRLVKKEFEETAAKAYYPARAISGKEPANGNEKVIKCEPADSGDMPSLTAVSYSCLLEVDGRDFLELPESWRKYLMKKAKLERWIIFLRGPDKKIWPILYHRRAGVDVLTNGWKIFAAAYGLNRGDDCLFELENKWECIFAVRKL
ncbi:PREDICTED: uncharacterized protein LOC109223638 isoform X2 [Nicotiana attenuata]|uniref:uncharacterized protein LOC109223638 isoform X2 n=1 Tax=Nicotiana attenuata TaxID=49451 RepID=UPI000904C1D8|nr:PREDICTED: uncharacterized protein LOC109223638 isoform X2 [Nicotiana attenuata]